ncbi:LysR family transcriptional regulator [Litchfieldella xinjiangensis]|uniref:LysR family transcriptional regulator n=1 Tax=Litchfieldella xinjiangensis TaxID=1166948 RepID=UPI0009DEE9AA|nr:LysR family transcriptional regulator [Halomonas xinjiangensis]
MIHSLGWVSSEPTIASTKQANIYFDYLGIGFVYMTFQQLRHFIAIIETGSLSQAAKRCYISQPSMSASIKALEQDLGCGLFTRHSKGLLPTAAGQALQQHAERMLREAQQARASVRSFPAELSGTLRLGVTETISAYMLPRLFQGQLDYLSGVRLEVSESSISETQRRLRADEIDIGLMVIDNVPPADDLHCEKLFETPRRLWAPTGHPLMRRSHVELSDVCEYPFILLEMDDHTTTWERYWQCQPHRPKVELRSHSIEAVRSLVGMGIGITILSSLVFRPWSLEGDHISRRELAEEVPGMSIGLLRKTGGTAEVSFFIDRLKGLVEQSGLLER